VIPAKDEAANITWVLERIPRTVGEVILVDGSSADDTVTAALRARPDIRIVSEPKPGKGAAVRAGFKAARGDFIVMIDADGSMDPREIERCLASLEERRSAVPSSQANDGYPLVKGSRFVTGGGTEDMSLVRRLGNRVLVGLVNVLWGTRFTDLCYGLFAFRRDALHKLELRAEGFELETEILMRALQAGVPIGEVPSFEAPRRSGRSNLRTWRDGWRVLRTLVRETVSRRRRRSGHLSRGKGR
jgi:glycosyltransferase involved in cell wall biosynthesis